MNISEFQNKVNLNKLLEEFFTPENIIKQAFNNFQFREFATRANALFEENKISIINSFFENIKKELYSENYGILSNNLSILIFEPFNQNHVKELKIIFETINSQLLISNFNSELMNFYWTMLDHILQEDIYDRFDAVIVETKLILKSKKETSPEKDLLLQKIEQHFGL